MRYILVAAPFLLAAAHAGAQEFKDEPAAHALYDKMLEALLKADTLSYESAYRWETEGREIGRCTYKAWLMKPNYFRLETTRRDGTAGGILVGDGEDLWIHWPGERPFFSGEDEAEWEKTNRDVYLTEPARKGLHSIAHKTSILGAGMCMAILNPSRFHGCRGSLDPYLDGVKALGEEEILGETCDVIEVSYMSHQRSKYFWLSRRDSLPRRLKEVVRVSRDIISEETWSDVRIGGEMDPSLFAWRPPEGWQRWRLPKAEDSLPSRGEQAPDFRLKKWGGGEVSLADYRGKVIWLCFWRVG